MDNFNEIKWRFPSNDYGEEKGINDSGISLFRGAPVKSLAREICQNSLDAAVESPVIVEFELFEMDSNLIPGRDRLTRVFDKCIDFWELQKSNETKIHFENAKEKIMQEKCSVLRVSDFNTCGLTGSSGEKNTNWTNLTKSSGQSDKSEIAGGSFGIGKFAPFACSEISTVYYNTLDSEGNEAHQGVVRVVTFTDDNGQNTQGIGYFGKEKNKPVFEQISLDSNFKRSTQGTDIFVMGYKFGGENWEDSILTSVLDGFLGAIWNGKLELKIGEIIVSKSTLGTIIEKFSEILDTNTIQYYKVLITEEVPWCEENVLGFGNIKFKILTGDTEATKKIAMIRKTGMKIMDQGAWNAQSNFVGVMFIEGDLLNQKLRSIENPQHTAWEPDRSKDPKAARLLIKEIKKCITRKLDELIKQSATDEIDAVGIGVYLPDDINENEETGTSEVLDEKIIEVEKKVINKKESLIRNEKKENDELEKLEVSEEGLDSTWVHGAGVIEKPGGRQPIDVSLLANTNGKLVGKKEVCLSRLVFLCVDKSNGKYSLFFESNETAENVSVEIYLSGETGSYEAPIKSVKIIKGETIEAGYSVEGHVIKGLNFLKNSQYKISVEIDYYDYCSMEVRAYEIKE